MSQKATKYRNFTLKNKITLSVLFVTIIVLFFTSVKEFLLLKSHLDDQYSKSINQTKSNIINSLNQLDNAYRIADIFMQQKVEQEKDKYFQPYFDAYEASGRDASKVDWASVAKKNGTQFFIFDKEGVIQYSYLGEKAKGVAWFKDNNLFEEYKEMLANDKIWWLRLKKDFVVGTYNSFVHIPFPDRQYLLDISIPFDHIKSALDAVDATKLANKLVKINPLLEKIRIFNYEGMPVGGSVKIEHKQNKDILALVTKLKKNKLTELEKKLMAKI